MPDRRNLANRHAIEGSVAPDLLAIARWNFANRRSIEAYWADKEMPAGVCETPGCGRRVGAHGVRRCVFCRQANYKRSS